MHACLFICVCVSGDVCVCACICGKERREHVPPNQSLSQSVSPPSSQSIHPSTHPPTPSPHHPRPSAHSPLSHTYTHTITHRYGIKEEELRPYFAVRGRNIAIFLPVSRSPITSKPPSFFQLDQFPRLSPIISKRPSFQLNRQHVPTTNSCPTCWRGCSPSHAACWASTSWPPTGRWRCVLHVR